MKFAVTFLCLAVFSHVAYSTKVHIQNHPLVILHAMQVHFGYRYAGFLIIGSVISICLAFIPFLRRGWFKRASIEDFEKQISPVKPTEEKNGEKNNIASEKENIGKLEVSDSLEEVQLSFGTDKPEVYLKMCQPFHHNTIRTAPFLCELLVQ